MITKFTLENAVIQRLAPSRDARPRDDGLLWINLEDPTNDECDTISREYAVPIEHLHAALDFNERPRVEYENSILLIVARTPFQDEDHLHVPYKTCSIAVILTSKAVITVCLKPGLAEALLRHKILGSGGHLAKRFALTLLLRISTTFIEYLQGMDQRVGQIEETLQESMQNKELVNMLHMEKSLIYFLTALKGNQSVMEKLRTGTPLIESAEERALLDDVLIENKQATDMAEIYSQIMTSLSDAFGAIVSNNVNKVMKVLTGLTVVVMIPSIIGALYGMNVALPFAESPHAFTLLCIVCLGLSFTVFFLLRKKNWM